ncbi:MAG: porin family protein [Myxococcales bacterium]|nr:porin family protein [Myxococcales bacterium]
MSVSTAAAQDGELPAVPPPPAPQQPVPEAPAGPEQAPPVTDEVPPPPPSYEAPPPALACVPDCRAGYSCIEGRCVSACNPPCGPGSVCTAAGSCEAATPSPPVSDIPSLDELRPRHAHDGFLLRVVVGPGVSWARERLAGAGAGEDVGRSGLSSSFMLDVGYAIVENFNLRLRIGGQVIPSPTVVVGGEERDVGGSADVGSGLLGLGVDYYFMPLNLRVGATIGPSGISYTDDAGDEFSTDSGLGFNLEVGMEWWVSTNWGLGGAAVLWLTNVSGQEGTESFGDDVQHRFAGIGLLFSASYQ